MSQKIIQALKNKNRSLVLELISMGEDFNEVDSKTGQTPLEYAIESGFLRAASDLVDIGANINFTNSDKKTPLMISSNSEALTASLLRRHQELDLNAYTDDGNTALHYAAINGNHEVCAMLISGGVDVDIKNKQGRTAYQEAVRHDNTLVMKTISLKLAPAPFPKYKSNKAVEEEKKENTIKQAQIPQMEQAALEPSYSMNGTFANARKPRF